jgi:sigma-E factor negative regulatory protein RseC
MIEEEAQVVAVNDSFAWVETERKSTCDSCAVNKGCGSATLSKVLGQRRSRLKVINSLYAQVGDAVVIGIHDNALVQGSFAVYAVPLLFMMLAALLGDMLSQQLMFEAELLVVIFAIIGLALGFAWLRYFTAKISRDDRYQAIILRNNTSGKSVLTPLSRNY